MYKKPIILIVDDQEDNRVAIKLALKREGYAFIEAENGREALNVIEETKPEIIFMDALMPQMDGFETTRALRKYADMERTPILMITALNEKEDRLKALESGVSDFIIKPFDKQELIARCRSYMNMVELNKKYIDATQNLITKLPNMGALQIDLKKMEDALVIVCSFDGYSSLSNFYSKDILERMEKAFISLFLLLMPLEFGERKFYHIKAGVYAFSVDRTFNTALTKEKTSKLLHEFYDLIREQLISFDDYEFTPLITFGAAIGDVSAYENAKTALEEAYKEGKSFLFADDVIERILKESVNNISWIKKIKLAIREDRFLPYFQPIYNNHTNKIEKYECLIRMIDTNGDIISPYKFLDIAKQAKYYLKLTRIMIDKSMKIFENREEEFSINLSRMDIENEEMFDYIIKCLEEKPHVAKRMIFELLEDENFDSFDLLKSFVSKVKSYGVKIAVDDFGSGYANFIRLRDFEPDILKIDGSLIKNIDTDPFSINMVQTIQSFAKKAGLQTVAEFVATEEIFHLIKEIGVDYSQGYFFSAPISLQELNAIDMPLAPQELNIPSSKEQSEVCKASEKA